jgi:hypothetical protein
MGIAALEWHVIARANHVRPIVIRSVSSERHNAMGLSDELTMMWPNLGPEDVVITNVRERGNSGSAESRGMASLSVRVVSVLFLMVDVGLSNRASCDERARSIGQETRGL